MSEPTPPPGLPFLGRYVVVAALVTLALAAAGFVLFAMAEIALPPGAAAIIPPMAAALHVGQLWGRIYGTVPATGQAWRWAAVAGLAYLALLLVLLPPFLPLLGGLAGLAVMLIAGAALMAVLLNRFFLVIGARSAVAGAKR